MWKIALSEHFCHFSRLRKKLSRERVSFPNRVINHLGISDLELIFFWDIYNSSIESRVEWRIFQIFPFFISTTKFISLPRKKLSFACLTLFRALLGCLMITNNISSDKNKKACRVLSEGFDDEMSPQLSFQSLVEVVKDMMNSISKQLNDTHLLTRELAFASPWVALLRSFSVRIFM